MCRETLWKTMVKRAGEAKGYRGLQLAKFQSAPDYFYLEGYLNWVLQATKDEGAEKTRMILPK